MCVGGFSIVGLRRHTHPTPPALCVGRGRAGRGSVEPPHPAMLWGRGQGVGLRETDLLGEARAGCLGRGRSRRQGVKDFGGARDQSVLLSPVPPLPKRRLFSLPPSFPLAGTGSEEAKGVEKGEPRASIWRAACLGRESGGGNVSRSGAKAGGGFACGWLY